MGQKITPIIGTSYQPGTEFHKTDENAIFFRSWIGEGLSARWTMRAVYDSKTLKVFENLPNGWYEEKILW